MFTDAQYSFYSYVKSRILTKNPDRLVAGILNAQDWPIKNIKFDAFYLLVLGEEPIGRQGYSQYSPMLFHLVQWVWMNKGTDTPALGVRQANRGDRFVTMQDMIGELLYGLAPGYGLKQTWALVNGTFTGSPTSIPNDTITWTPATFHQKQDKSSGLAYGSAQIRIWDTTDVITS
jgi:hypothetical protein